MSKATIVRWPRGVIFKGCETFKPCEDYCTKSRGNRLFHSNGIIFSADFLALTILADYTLREYVQHDEWLQKEHQARKKAIQNNDGPIDLSEWEEALGMSRLLIDIAEREIYRLESLLPQQPLRKMYDRVRENSTWYLHKDLVQDCIRKGGCCSRGCRCCENRHLSSTRQKGIGHCTSRCYCCQDHRGFKYTDVEVEGIRHCLEEDLLSPCPGFLLTMTDAYFSKPGMLEPGNWPISRVAIRQLKRLIKGFGFA